MIITLNMITIEILSVNTRRDRRHEMSTTLPLDDDEKKPYTETYENSSMAELNRSMVKEQQDFPNGIRTNNEEKNFKRNRNQVEKHMCGAQCKERVEMEILQQNTPPNLNTRPHSNEQNILCKFQLETTFKI